MFMLTAGNAALSTYPWPLHGNSPQLVLINQAHSTVDPQNHLSHFYEEESALSFTRTFI
jgi:hypothetical protein